MFFIGATGQLLTLILTVGLPFIILVSGHQKIETNNNNSILEISQDLNLDFSTEKDSFVYDWDLIVEKQNITSKFEISPPENYAVKSIDLRWNSFPPNSSGNKAPPVLV